MASIVVSYPRSSDSTFDKDYYANTHIPLVQRHWEPCGMTGAEILFPIDDAQPYAAMVILRFPDQASIDRAMGSPGTPEVMADVPRFTNIQPAILRAAD
ncbi:MAG: EthD family reductase [Sphingomonadales bacterium]|nr:EthD family reductase [Sphingomonadales bacterium]MDE2568513.1 EthD family reductase [Sphingomonadales bacterium]